MKFTFLTLFPELITGYFTQSILARALKNSLLEIEVICLKDFAQNVYGKLDEPQIGGGAGQVICADVLHRALQTLPKEAYIIFLTPCAPLFKREDSLRFAREYKHIVFVCGRYEGFDERSVEIWADEVFCIGDFIVTGGELPALCMCDSISRQIEGVLGNPESLKGESFENHLLEAPIFARTIQKMQKFEEIAPPLEYSKGNHSRIDDLRNRLSEFKTKFHRADLYQKWKIRK